MPLIFTVTVPEWLIVPLVPTTLNVYIPVWAVDGTVIESIDTPEPPDPMASEVGVKVTVQPAGTSVMFKPIVPTKLLIDVIVIVELVEVPAKMLKTDGEAESEKLGAGGGTGVLFFPKSRV